MKENLERHANTRGKYRRLSERSQFGATAVPNVPVLIKYDRYYAVVPLQSNTSTRPEFSDNRDQNYMKTLATYLAILTAGVIGFMIGTTYPICSFSKYEVSSLILSYGGDMDSASTTNNSTDRIDNLTDRNEILTGRPHNSNGRLKIYERSNPKGAERLPPGIIVSESDLYQHRLWGNYFEDVPQKPKYLAVFTVAYQQKNIVNAAVQKFSENFTIMLFHYDGRVNEWNEFEWAQRAIHISAIKQAKWWYAKRFLHPDIVAAYDYIFIWDEDLGVDHFNAEEYIKLVKKYGLEVSQPAVEAYWNPSFSITKRRNDTEVHRCVSEKELSKCSSEKLTHQINAATYIDRLVHKHLRQLLFVEIMAPVFSRRAWRCIWHMIQNDLPHGFGMDYVFRNCVEPSQEKIGVVDAQWIFHYGTPTLKDQGREDNRTEKVQEIDIRRYQELGVFMYRWNGALKDYCKEKGIVPSDYTDDLTLSQ